MRLNSVEIQGFKTFPDKTSLKFEEDLVAVVGPNGSGKSNVSDAIRWVLGEQSTRNLRCSKMEDVIFKGSTSRKALGYAEVSMNIDNSDKTLNFDSDTIKITRRYYRSGESEYLINKATVRLKDINELFMDTGLGRDGYSIIGQGKIDAIVAARSEERREIFEEASGISRFRYRKEESERRLAKTEENLVRLRDISSELEQRLEPLRIQSEKATKFIAFDKEKTGLEIGIWVNTLDSSSKILREQTENVDTTLAQYNKIEEELENLNNENGQIFSKNAFLNSQIELERKNSADIDEEVLRAEGEISVIENDISHNKQNLVRIENEIKETGTTNSSINEKIEMNKLALDEKEKEVNSLNEKYVSVSNELENLRKNTDGLDREISEISINKAKLSTQSAENRIKLSSFTSSIAEIESSSNSLDEKISQNTQNINNLEKEVADLKDTFTQMTERATTLDNSLSGFTLKLNKQEEKAQIQRAEIDKLNLDANEQIRKAKLLEDLERNLEGFTYSVKTIIKEADKGILKGIDGTVSKLIKTSQEHSVAIEIALGAAVQNIIVETDKDAKNAIAMLKKTSGGRATFLPLSTIKGSIIDVSNIEDVYGFIGIAANLVTCDKKYDEVKKSLLGRTIVAEDLDTAVVIAKKISYKFRVVSLDGQVVNAGGSLTGGSQTKNSGLLSRGIEIEKAKDKANKIVELANQKKNEFNKLVQEISAVKAESENLKLEISALSEDKVRVDTEIKAVLREKENADALKKVLESEKKNSISRIQEINEDMSQLQNVINEIEIKINDIDKRLENISGNREDRQQKCDKFLNKMQEIKLSVFALQKDKELIASNNQNLIDQQNNLGELFKRLELEKENYFNKIKIKEDEIVKTNNLINSLKEKAINKKLEIENYSNERASIETKLSTLRITEKELMTSRENSGKELARLQERVNNLQNEYDNIIKKLWEEYELTKSEAQAQAIEIENIKTATQRLSELKNKIRGLGTVNLSAVEEYIEVRERFDYLSEQLHDVEKSKAELIKLINELTSSMQEQFTEKFAIIASNFAEIFKELFGGGTASLTFSNPENVLSSGIDIKVHPPGKIVSHIEALSGGEKALVAISIYFAIMRVNPPPFCMLDEVEAALDDVNVRRFADYVRRMKEQSQFIVITHRRGTMETADILYGVTMQEDGISKLLAIKAEEVESKLGIK